MADEQKLVIRIETIEDLRAALSVESSLKNRIQLTEALGQKTDELKSKLQAQSSVINKATSGGAGAGGESGLIEGLAGKLAGVAAGVFTVAKAFEFAKDSVVAFASEQRHILELNQKLANMGQFSVAYSENLQRMALETAEATGTMKEDWYGVIGTLTRFGATSVDIEQNIEVVKGLSVVVGSVSGAAEAFARATQGNFRALARYSREIREATNETDKMAAVLKLAERNAGTLETGGKGLAGAWNALKLKTGELMESFGGAVTQGGWLERTLRSMAGAAGNAASDIKSLTDADKTLADVTNKVAPAMKGAGDAADGMAHGGMAAARSEVEKLVDKLKDLLGELKAVQQQQDEMTDAKMAAELAAYDRKAEDEGISKEDQAIAHEEIRSRYAKQKLDENAKLHKQERNTMREKLLDFDEVAKARENEIESKRGEAADRERMAREGGTSGANAEEDARAKSEAQDKYNKAKAERERIARGGGFGVVIQPWEQKKMDEEAEAKEAAAKAELEKSTKRASLSTAAKKSEDAALAATEKGLKETEEDAKKKADIHKEIRKKEGEIAVDDVKKKTLEDESEAKKQRALRDKAKAEADAKLRTQIEKANQDLITNPNDADAMARKAEAEKGLKEGEKFGQSKPKQEQLTEEQNTQAAHLAKQMKDAEDRERKQGEENRKREIQDQISRENAKGKGADKSYLGMLHRKLGMIGKGRDGRHVADTGSVSKYGDTPHDVTQYGQTGGALPKQGPLADPSRASQQVVQAVNQGTILTRAGWLAIAKAIVEQNAEIAKMKQQVEAGRTENHS